MSKHILLVEDNDEIRLIITKILRRAKMRVTSVTNVHEAFEFLKTQEPDMIVTDFQMPGVRGDVLVEAALKANIPIIMITALGTEAKSRLFKLGHNIVVIDKPFDLKKFATFLNDLINPKGLRQEEPPLTEDDLLVAALDDDDDDTCGPTGLSGAA